MNRFEEMAREASAAVAAEKAVQDAVAAKAQALGEARDAETCRGLEEHVMPLFREAIKGLRAAGLEVEQLSPRLPFLLDRHLQIGHNKVGRTGARVSTLTVSFDGSKFRTVVHSENGSDREWSAADPSQVRDTIEQAVGDCLDRWHQRNGYQYRRP